MAKAKKVVRRAWTKDDVRTMKMMAKAKSGVAKIAKVMGRTPCDDRYGGKAWDIPIGARLRTCPISEIILQTSTLC
jgi:hypothetical protein